MKKITAKILLALALAPAWISPAADNADNLSRLDQALKAVAAFEYGKDSAPLTLTEQIVVESATNNVQRAAVEERLLHLLHSQATRDAKEFVCRQLFTIGTERSIPQLEALLTDPGLAHVARLALGRNESPAALESLLRAVAAAPATIQIGIINTLGLRRYEAALPALEKLVASGDLQIAKAAASALGEIGGTKAVKILQANRAKAGEELRRSIDAALLASADHFLASGEIPAASEIYEGLYAPTQTGNFRIAALRGLAAAQQEKALPTLAAAMRGADIGMRAAAISFTSSLKGSGSTRGLVDLLPTLAVETQPLLLNALGARGDGVAIPGVLAAVQSENASVRAAALIALGAIGDSSVVSSLLRAAGGTAGPEPAAARASLVQLHRGDVNGTLVRAFSGGDTKIVMEAIRALAGRRATATFQDIRKMVGGADPAVRLEAIHALGILADENTYSDLVSLAAGLKNSEDLGSLEDAVTAALPRVSSPEKQAAPLLSMLNGSSAAAKPVLLRLLSITGAPGALLALQAALKDSNPLVAEAAVRSLSDWPDAGPADDMLKLAQTATVPAYKVFALRGDVRMAASG